MKRVHSNETETAAAAVARQGPGAGVEKTARADPPGRTEDCRIEADDRATEEAGYGYGV